MVGCCFFQAEDGIRDDLVTGVQTCALPISPINLQGPMDSTLARKATNDAAAGARTVAAQRGHSIEWAEKAVRSAVAASETEAVDLKVVDFIAATLPELLAKADGRTWRRGEERRVLRVR